MGDRILVPELCEFLRLVTQTQQRANHSQQVDGPQCTYDEIVQFMNTTQTFMDQTEWVERYSWFGAMAALPANVNNVRTTRNMI